MSLSGNVQTVLGLVPPSALGITLTHEHLCCDAMALQVEPWTRDADKINLDFSLQNSGWIRQYPYSHKNNLLLNTAETETAVIEDVQHFKVNGGGTIVENSIIGLGRNIIALKRIADATGVNIVAGTGYYVAKVHPRNMGNRSTESITNEMLKDITEGCENTSIKCGIIGELGCSWPLHGNEKKVLQGAAEAQSQLHCPLMVHPGRNPKSPFEILKVLQEAGADVNKITMAHLDRTIFDLDQLVEFAKLGSYCEFDLFGIECSYYQQQASVDMTNDAQRMDMIKRLVQEGFEDKIVISHDIHTKHRVMRFGGHGYSHILLSIVPRLLQRGVSQKVIDKILIHNPKTWLTFN